MKRSKYEKELHKLQVRLCHLQRWVKEKGLRVVIVFEGRDGAGKGGTIRAHDRACQPARVPGRRAAGAIRPREDAGVHAALPAALSGCRRSRHLRSQLVQPRRRRARDGVLLRQRSTNGSSTLCPQIEKFLVDGGIILIKLWMEVSNDEQKRRFEARISDPLRQWKLSPMDLPSRRRWYDYSRARDEMLKKTDTRIAPWYIVRSDDKKNGAAEHHRSSPVGDSVQEAEAGEGEAAGPLDEGGVRR